MRQSSLRLIKVFRTTKHFKLSEMIRSGFAERNKIDNYPKEEVLVENLKALCELLLILASKLQKEW